MFINIQFPFIDLRYFSDENTGKLNTPDLPIYNFISRNQFVRNFGSVETRVNTGIGYDENAYVNARRAVKIDPEDIKEFNAIDDLSFEKLLFRRLFTDGRANYRLEYGINCEYNHEYRDGFEKYSIDSLIDKVLGIKAKVKKSSKKETLARAVSSLLPLYLEASTSKNMQLPSKHTLIGANPMIYMEISKDEFNLSPKARLVAEKSFGNFDLYYEETVFDRIPFSVWIIAYERREHLSRDYKKKFYARNLRLALLRQNYERECLKKVLLYISVGKIKPNDKFQEYINKCDYINQVINNESGQFKYELTYRNLVLFIHRWQEVIDPNLEKILLDTTNGIRSSIKQKLQEFIKIEIKGDIVMGNKNVIKSKGSNNVIVSESEFNGSIDIGDKIITNNEMPPEVIKLFADLKKKAEKIDDNKEIMEKIDDAEKNYGKSSFKEKVQNFVYAASDYLSLFGTLIPVIKGLAGK